MTWSCEILCTCIYTPKLGRYIHLYMRNIFTCAKHDVMHKHATAPGQQTIMWDDTFLELYPTFP